ncbi:MAG: ATP-binding protein [Desulfobacterales bacterium]|nr:ATP-binding protein [Desulfobacterales bacterium]
MKTKSKSKGKNHQGSTIRERAASYKVASATEEDVLPYASFEVTNFRCFDNFKIESLGRVNLITGVNNSGKTTLLEALFLHIGSRNPGLVMIVNSWRGLNIISESTENQWTSLFWKFKDSQTIRLSGINSNKAHRSLEIHISSSGSFLRGEKAHFDQAELISGPRQDIVLEYVDEAGKQYKVKGMPVFVKKDNMMSYELRIEPSLPRATMTGIFVTASGGSNLNEEMQRFSDLRKKEKDGFVLSALRIIEPRLEQLEILTYQGISMIHGYLKGYDEPVPSPLLGDGVRRSLSVLLAIGSAEKGVVLVDEIENGIHHSAMKALWTVIAEASRTFKCQVFATTHSNECILTAHDAFKENKIYDLKLYRLDRKNGSIQTVMYDEETLDAALSIPLEVRGWPIQ